MAKKTINFRVSYLTEKKLVELSLRTGMLKTEILSIAIDRMYREETKEQEEKKGVGGYVDFW